MRRRPHDVLGGGLGWGDPPPPSLVWTHEALGGGLRWGDPPPPSLVWTHEALQGRTQRL